MLRLDRHSTWVLIGGFVGVFASVLATQVEDGPLLFKPRAMRASLTQAEFAVPLLPPPVSLCGDGLCEAAAHESPLTCPDDCPVLPPAARAAGTMAPFSADIPAGVQPAFPPPVE